MSRVISFMNSQRLFERQSFAKFIKEEAMRLAVTPVNGANGFNFLELYLPPLISSEELETLVAVDDVSGIYIESISNSVFSRLGEWFINCALEAAKESGLLDLPSRRTEVDSNFGYDSPFLSWWGCEGSNFAGRLAVAPRPITFEGLTDLLQLATSYMSCKNTMGLSASLYHMTELFLEEWANCCREGQVFIPDTTLELSWMKPLSENTLFQWGNSVFTNVTYTQETSKSTSRRRRTKLLETGEWSKQQWGGMSNEYFSDARLPAS